MTRNLKTLGLALVAALALSALVASAASAQSTQGELTSDGANTSVTLVGTQTGVEGSNATTSFGNRFECAGAKYTGHESFTTAPHKVIPIPATKITITPHYGSCLTKTGFGNFPTTVHMNGCDYEFVLRNTTGGVTGTYGLDTFIVCPVGKNIQVTQFTSAANHTAGNAFCTVSIEEKATAYTGLHATTGTPGGTIGIHGTIGGIKSHKHSPSGSFLCPTASTETAELHLDIGVEGFNAEGKHTDISITDTKH